MVYRKGSFVAWDYPTSGGVTILISSPDMNWDSIKEKYPPNEKYSYEERETFAKAAVDRLHRESKNDYNSNSFTVTKEIYCDDDCSICIYNYNNHGGSPKHCEMMGYSFEELN